MHFKLIYLYYHMDMGLDGNETEIIISIFACPYDRIFSVSTSVQWNVYLWYFIQHSIQKLNRVVLF